jgi:hypothetical protein
MQTKRAPRADVVFCRVRGKTKKQLEALAITRDIPMSQIVREALRAYLASQNGGAHVRLSSK